MSFCSWKRLQQDATARSLLATVEDVQQEKDPHGKIITRVSFSSPNPLGLQIVRTSYRLLKSVQSAHVWPYPTDPDVVILSVQASGQVGGQVDLESITRQIKVGDPVLFEIPNGTPAPQLVSVTSYSEVVWYANPAGKLKATKSPPPDDTQHVPPIPIPHTSIGFIPALTGNWDSQKTSVLVRYAWQEVGC